jgi:hypothetical protein
MLESAAEQGIRAMGMLKVLAASTGFQPAR